MQKMHLPPSILIPTALVPILLVHVHASTSTVLYTLTASAAASSSTPGSTQYTDDAAFQSTMLDAHNFFRDEHNASALAWNDTSRTYATGWAGKCVFQHSVRPALFITSYTRNTIISPLLFRSRAW
jgi:uncharacterized protein YkwD